MQTMMTRFTDRLAAARPDFTWAIRWPDGTVRKYGDGPVKVTLSIRTKSALFRLLREGSLGFGEAYMNEEIDVEGDFAELIRFAFTDAFHSQTLSLLSRVGNRLAFLSRKNTLHGSRRNIHHHYDLGNEFFSLWLDREMTYSCAYFLYPDISLEDAQKAKHEHLCRKLQIEPGMTLLDVGCGWGALARHAAREHGAKVLGITLSKKQVEYARKRAREEGLEDQVEFELTDWRELKKRFDRVVSVGMFEHVGRENYPAFFRRWRRFLKPGGVGVLHTIGKDIPTPPDPWTQKYIFPGGVLPALSEIASTSAHAGLTVTDVENLRLHYALTLEEWLRRFESHVDEVEAMYDKRFVRMWRFFLVGSAVGFRFGDLRLWQVTMTHGTPNNLPLTREHLYSKRKPQKMERKEEEKEKLSA